MWRRKAVRCVGQVSYLRSYCFDSKHRENNENTQKSMKEDRRLRRMPLATQQPQSRTTAGEDRKNRPGRLRLCKDVMPLE